VLFERPKRRDRWGVRKPGNKKNLNEWFVSWRSPTKPIGRPRASWPPIHGGTPWDGARSVYQFTLPAKKKLSLGGNFPIWSAFSKLGAKCYAVPKLRKGLPASFKLSFRRFLSHSAVVPEARCCATCRRQIVFDGRGGGGGGGGLGLDEKERGKVCEEREEEDGQTM
jgi:hypothetical protein